MKNERAFKQTIDWMLYIKEVVAKDSAYSLTQTKPSPLCPSYRYLCEQCAFRNKHVQSSHEQKRMNVI